MSEISVAWELGQNYGHITRLMPLVDRLRALGHSPHLILRDLSRLHSVIKAGLPAVFQAPVWLPKLIDPPRPQGYADILLAVGYADKQGLRGLITAWMNLFELNRTALVIADHSPTAMLAARILQLPCVTLGSGFFSPPRLTPMPPMCWWLEADEERLQASEDLVLSNINENLEHSGAQPLENLCDMLAVDETFLRNFAELDHYPQRAIMQSPKPVYLGPDMLLDGGEQPEWPDAQGTKVFAYLNAGWDGLDDMMKTFQALPVSVLAHVPGLSLAQQKRYSASNIRVTSALLQMEKVRRECEFAVCHGGIATVSAMLTAGRPLLLAPTQLEQTIVCKNIERLGVGLTLRTDTKRYPPRRLLEYLMKEPQFTQKAMDFAERYRDYSQDDVNDGIAARCHEILQQGRNPGVHR